MIDVLIIAFNAFFGYVNLNNALNTSFPKWIRAIAGVSALCSIFMCVSFGLVLLT